MSGITENFAKKHLKIVENETCFSVQEKYNVACQRQSCPNWITDHSEQNCAIISAKHGPKTLHEIGSLYNLSRMRICQLEKTIFKKAKVD